MIQVDLHDESEPGQAVVRKAGELDKTVGEKLRDGSMDLESAPDDTTLRYARMSQDSQQLVIEIPRFDLASLGKLRIAFWILLAFLGAWVGVSLYFKDFLFLLFGAFFSLVVLGGVFRTEHVTLTSDSLNAQLRFVLVRKTRRIPLSELEELALSNVAAEENEESDELLHSGEIDEKMHSALNTLFALGSAIMARSDTKSISIGRTLPESDLKIILGEMQQWIRSK